jgi:hypothetical protein
MDSLSDAGCHERQISRAALQMLKCCIDVVYAPTFKVFLGFAMPLR